MGELALPRETLMNFGRAVDDVSALTVSKEGGLWHGLYRSSCVLILLLNKRKRIVYLYNSVLQL